MNGAQALVESLLQEQVEHIFGYAGATICPAVDALKEHPEIGYTLVRTEQDAGHMASRPKKLFPKKVIDKKHRLGYDC